MIVMIMQQMMSDFEAWCHTGIITGITIRTAYRNVILAKLHLVII